MVAAASVSPQTVPPRRHPVNDPGEAEKHREQDRVRVSGNRRERDRSDPRRAAEQSAHDCEADVVLPQRISFPETTSRYISS